MSKPKPRSRPVNTRKLYEKHHNVVLPDSMQVHHVLPTRLGGNDSITNLVALDVPGHAEAHLRLYEQHGDSRDLCAYHMILGHNTEALKVSASNGGKAAARAFKERNQLQGFQAFDSITQAATASAGGKVGGAKQFALGIGIHAQTRAERLALASAGGLKSCETNGWRDPKVQSENGKRGGVKNKGFVWVNDGKTSYKLTTKEQGQGIAEYLFKTGRALGRIQAPNVTCLHCSKSGPPGPMGRWHFNNCKKAENENL